MRAELLVLCLLAPGALAAAPGLDVLARDVGEPAPIVRIGLADAHAVEVSSPSAFRLLDAASGKPVWRGEFRGTVRVIAEGGPPGGAPSLYRIQVGAFSDPAAAARERERLERATGASGVVHHDPDRGTYRVRMGEETDRLGLSRLLERLRGMGLQGLWIAEEPATAARVRGLRVVDDEFESRLLPARPLVAVPGEDPLSVAGARYRGLVELRLSPWGTVRPVNWIGLEPYLRGVVPAELGPEVWPELEALKAQAVAARTYLRRNLEQFSDEGFDLCATPRCQVYKGLDAEHPLSDRAVRETEGEVLTWEREPIVALYTANCGGHTEDGSEIFPEHAEPYLKGVPCRAEGAALATLRATIAGRAPEPVADEVGNDVTRDAALLRAAAVVGPGLDPQAALLPAELRSWTSALARRSGRPEPSGPAGEAATLAAAAESLVSDVGWSERARVLLSNADLPALLRVSDRESLPASRWRALAYLASVDALKPGGDGRLDPLSPPTRARLFPSLVRVGESFEAFGLEEAVVSGVGASSIRVIRGKGELRIPLDRAPWLFTHAGGRAAPVAELELWPGDRIRYRAGAAGAIDFLELRPPVKGASDDRSARVYSWEVRKSRDELEDAINRRIAIGRLQDLRPARRGVSGRVVELDVVGDGGSARVRGFDVRRLLDLRESLAVIEVQRDEAGEIRAAVFAGKGWGHGVGLCQVGAYGMALRGATHREILAHYYSGATLAGTGDAPAE